MYSILSLTRELTNNDEPAFKTEMPLELGKAFYNHKIATTLHGLVMISLAHASFHCNLFVSV